MSGFSLQEFMRRDQVFDIVNAAQSERLNVDKQILLYLEGLSVSFDGFKAINDLNLYIRDGELRCIIGPNGAGKTTMMDIITGKTKPDTGTAYFGQTIDLLNMDEPAIAEAGIGRKFQKPTVFENLSVFANLELAMAQNRDFISLYTAKLSSEQSDRIADVQQLIGLAEQSFKLAGALSHGQKQWLEIGMLLMQRPRLLLVDEPVAGMTHQEMDKTAELLISLAGKHSVVVVEHDMEFVRNLAEGGRTVSVLHQGSVLAEGTMDQVQNDDRVKQVYLGE
ncbi:MULTISPECIES: urea ABC transporter ATP-binding protein UrtD [unclassified Marinobacterium]|uniref:urea ABC transporter ATP-binding protein UrtD n=1 Tax=unclassified Marinobacterium TaxID=2644139 RepID=UPI00156A5AEA|nr:MULTISPECIES: urea ABC transporter ATP-binding protein UrtD [unclassified Marinobacterium]NRP16557.1 Lipopolysaccharide export system ATP-binding protein LptB [Marinobacterium sp. xm-a-152]NRP39209.1 Lipopolysaccharide export system ATP-binding protein LptB [Marinobacterium sp. xm-a-121]NRP48211.1 Lipopolysaccharide export system ATP-binding protein LptB [Marinobacterium sp. xm-d-543]NRP60590.1 Lipopolysaccharide export system ATP-binding protein LptB [Marinobacterium sp. xm-d-564]NRP95723.